MKGNEEMLIESNGQYTMMRYGGQAPTESIKRGAQGLECEKHSDDLLEKDKVKLDVDDELNPELVS